MNSIKIVLLDLGGVVFKSTGISNEKIDWNIISKLNYKHGADLNIGKSDLAKFLHDYNTLSNQNLSGQEFLKLVFDTLEINRELIVLLQSYCKIIIVSDNYKENIEYISKRYKFESWAIQQIYSFDYKMVKSNSKFFKKLLKDLKGFQADELLLIDDSPEKLNSALHNGIKGLLYQNNTQIKKEIENIFQK